MIRICLVAASMAALACARATAPPVAEGPPLARLRGLDFSASLEVAESSPQSLEGEVRITNRGTNPETLVFGDECPVRLRVYEVRGSRVAPVWEGPRICPDGPVTVAIAPGETETLSIPPTTAPDVLRGELSDAAYRVTVWLAPDDRIIEIEAGEVELSASR
ncbi:MAG TPA: hypothetical protein VEY33_05830 [Gemmatimonadota bacterium]|nr:hypothetical protein [Gemmatimonadota bacterium]